MRLGQQPLELGALGVELSQPLSLRDLHAAELGAPLVERRTAEVPAAATILDGKPRLGLSQEPNDLFLPESALLDVRHSPDG